MQSAIELKNIKLQLADIPSSCPSDSRKAAYSSYMEIQLEKEHFRLDGQGVSDKLSNNDLMELIVAGGLANETLLV